MLFTVVDHNVQCRNCRYDCRPNCGHGTTNWPYCFVVFVIGQTVNRAIGLNVGWVGGQSGHSFCY